MGPMRSTVWSERQLSQLGGRFPAAMRPARSLASALLLFLFACDGGGAVPDAATPNGSWRLISRTASGATTQDASLDGTLVLGGGEYALAIAAPLTGVITTYSLSGSATALQLGDGSSVPFTLGSGATRQLSLQLPEGTLVFAPASDATQTDAYTVTGTVTLADGTPSFTAARVALIFLSRKDTGTGFVNDVRDDLPLTFNGKTA